MSDMTSEQCEELAEEYEQQMSEIRERISELQAEIDQLEEQYDQLDGLAGTMRQWASMDDDEIEEFEDDDDRGSW